MDGDFVRPYPHRYNAVARIYEAADGRLWVTHEELLEAGYQSIEADTVLWLNNTFYEVQGYSSTGGSWWIEAIDPEAEFADLPVLSDADEAAEA